jgi:tellurite resistance protein TerC
MTYFSFADYWWFYLGFTGFVLLLLALDLGLFHRKAHIVSFREATIWSVLWIALALTFNFAFYRYIAWKFSSDPKLLQIPGFDPESAARQMGLEFLASYIVEKTLSLDNIFIFVVVFAYFGIPALYQHRVLFYGIAGALIFRAVFIALGSALLQYHWVILMFGAFLILTGAKMIAGLEKKIEPEKNPAIRLFRRFVPVTTEFHGQRFFVRPNRSLYATPLFLALLVVEISDIIFAIDSVPAIFAITREPLIVFNSNVFAIFGLRALYFLLAGAIERFAQLKYGLAVVLVFIGLKMVWLNDAFGGKFPITWSLGVIGGVIALSIICSLLAPRSKQRILSGKDNTEHEMVLENRPNRWN